MTGVKSKRDRPVKKSQGKPLEASAISSTLFFVVVVVVVYMF